MTLEVQDISLSNLRPEPEGLNGEQINLIDGLQRSFGGLKLNEESSSTTYVKENSHEGSQGLPGEASSYVLATDSYMDGNMDQWILGNTYAEAAVQSNSNERRVPVVQRSTLAATSSFNMARVWCLLALLLPLLNSNGSRTWHCTPSMVFNSADYFLAHVTDLAMRARAHISRIARQQVARDCFATAMDLILVVYAFGFLVLSMYQAAIIG